jgi:SH3-like domain-containing protein
MMHGKTTFICFLIAIAIFVSVAPSHSLCVKRSDVNLRSGPGTKYRKTGELFKYTPLKRLKTRGKWFQVRNVDGEKHWIHRNLITTRYKCAIVKVSEANIRTGPGTKYKEIDYSPSIRYETFKVLRTRGSWVKVEDEFEGRGWIYRKLLWIQ